MRRLVTLHQHKHTGKLIHHRHTSYWALVLLTALCGVLVALVDRTAQAATLEVSATVPAPIPTEAPVITSPVDGQIVHTADVEFKGSCPVVTPAVIIALYENATLLGSTPCEADGSFHLTVSLTPGSHLVTARVVTITGQFGQSSTPVHVTYTLLTPTPATPPASPSPAPSTPAEPMPSESLAGPLAISLDSPFLSYQPGSKATVTVTLRGGAAPYSLTIWWGDGTSSTYEKVASETPLTLSHVYHTADSSLFNLTMTDVNGRTLTRWYALINTAPAKTPSAGFSLARLLDNLGNNTLTVLVIGCISLLISLVLLWRYEHLRYPNLVGIPLHYQWQRPANRRKR